MLLGPDVIEQLSAQLPDVAGRTVAAIIAEIDEYRDPLRGSYGENITAAVQLALGTFLRLLEDKPGTRSEQAALDGAYDLGRGEARSGRTVDALLRAYRVGTRTAWRDWGTAAVAAGVDAGSIALFAERVFAFIDALSAASVTGHSDETAVTGRAREVYRERLVRALLDGAPEEELRERAEQAAWPVVPQLAAVLLPRAALTPELQGRSLVASPELLDARENPETAVLLMPATGSRAAFLRRLAGVSCVAGPAVPWADVRRSYARALQAQELLGPASGGLDATTVLGDLVLHGNPDALAELREKMLEPLASHPPQAADRLRETLLSWLLHQGRREDVARDLSVHPQTVRYRMTQVREAYGERLLDPRFVRDLVLACT